MNSRVKRLWVEALRSGEYQQGRNALRADDRFCCLGVLCDVYIKETSQAEWETDEGGNSSDYSFVEKDGNSGRPSVPVSKFSPAECYLPSSVIEWAGLLSENPKVKVEGSSGTFEETLACLNDDKVEFDSIASIIEQQL